MKRLLALLMAVLFTVGPFQLITHQPYLAQTDRFIETDLIANRYVSGDNGITIGNQMRFRDLPGTHWAHEAVSRMSALEIIKGYTNGTFGPSTMVSNEVLLTMLVRLAGREAEAMVIAENAALVNDNGDDIRRVWSRGYLQVAADLGLITQQQLEDAFFVMPEPEPVLDEAGEPIPQEPLEPPELTFFRGAAVTREQVAKWLIQTLGTMEPVLIEPAYELNRIYGFSDVGAMGGEFFPYIEAVAKNEIMIGSNGAFNPKGFLTRAEMAQIFKNLEATLYNSMGYESHIGTIGKIRDFQSEVGGEKTNTTEFLVRHGEGHVDMLVYSTSQSSGGMEQILDTPTLKDRGIGSMMDLEAGALIEYIVEPETNRLVYIRNIQDPTIETLEGRLHSIENIDDNRIQLQVANVLYTYPIVSGLYDANRNRLVINETWYNLDQAPLGEILSVELMNGVIRKLTRVPKPALYQEVSGIVKAVNTDFRYIVITDWQGNEVRKSYQLGQVVVQKQHYYDSLDDQHNLMELFPDYGFEKNSDAIVAIEVGDIVHMRLDANNPQLVTLIQAKTNYVVRYGRVRELNNYGAEGSALLLDFDDGTTALYQVSPEVFIKKQGRNVTLGQIQNGDTVRLLVNQAVLAPGTVYEEIKEIVIDAYGSEVAGIYKGQLGTYNSVQQTVDFFNGYDLRQTGWYNHQLVKTLKLGRDIAYFYNGKPVTFSFLNNSLLGRDLEAYVVTINDYGAERIRMISVRDGRDSVIPFGNITYSNGFDTLRLIHHDQSLMMDAGTIVVKNNRLVEIGNVMSPDYAQVVLNGDRFGAVVVVQPEPSNEAIDIFRARLASVDAGNSFQVFSHAALVNMNWIYSPVERIFTMDHTTKIIDEAGNEIPHSAFISYSELTKVDEVYTVIAEGTKAQYVIQNPYVKNGLTGEVYQTDNDQIRIRDVMVYSDETGNFSPLSLTNSYAYVNLLANSIILKNNKRVTVNDLEIGDRLRIMTESYLLEDYLLTGNREIDGYIIRVER